MFGVDREPQCVVRVIYCFITECLVQDYAFLQVEVQWRQGIVHCSSRNTIKKHVGLVIFYVLNTGMVFT